MTTCHWPSVATKNMTHIWPRKVPMAALPVLDFMATILVFLLISWNILIFSQKFHKIIIYFGTILWKCQDCSGFCKDQYENHMLRSCQWFYYVMTSFMVLNQQRIYCTSTMHINNAQNCTLLFFKTTNLCKEGKVWEWLHIFQDQPMQDEI